MASNARKQRTINNSIVDIDNVVIGPGDAYATWIDIAKHKLWDREFALLQQRREACNLIIVRMIKIFSGNQSHLLDGYNLNVSKMEAPAFRTYRQQLQSQLMDGNSPLIAKYMQSIDTLLTNWKGYHPTKDNQHISEIFSTDQDMAGRKQNGGDGASFMAPNDATNSRGVSRSST
eukprot:171025_1